MIYKCKVAFWIFIRIFHIYLNYLQYIYTFYFESFFKKSGPSQWFTKRIEACSKKIYKITADFDLSTIEHGTHITIDGAKVGIFCSGYLQEGIALIREGDSGAFDHNTPCIIEGRSILMNVDEWY